MTRKALPWSVVAAGFAVSCFAAPWVGRLASPPSLAPSGLSQSALSQAKPLIDYRKGARP